MAKFFWSVGVHVCGPSAVWQPCQSKKGAGSYVYADKAQSGVIWKYLRCQKQKRKRSAWEQYRQGQIPNTLPLSERPL